MTDVAQVRTLAVACNDLGRFIETHPHGRYIVSDLRGESAFGLLISCARVALQRVLV